MSSISRRSFVKIAGISALGISSLGSLGFNLKGVLMLIDPDDSTAVSGHSQWAAKELEKSLLSEGIDVFKCS